MGSKVYSLEHGVYGLEKRRSPFASNRTRTLIDLDLSDHEETSEQLQDRVSQHLY